MSQPLGCGLTEGWLGIAAVVADGLVVRGEQPLVRGRENDEVPAGLKVLGGAGKLGAVVGNVFEHVHVKNCVELVMIPEIGDRADLHPAARRQFAGGDRSVQAIRERRVGLKAGPASTPPSQRKRVVPPWPAPTSSTCRPTYRRTCLRTYDFQ